MKRTATLTILAALVASPIAAQDTWTAARARALAKKSQDERQRTVVRERMQQSERGDTREEATENFSKSVRIGAQGEIDLSNMSGSVTVTRGSGNEAKIEAVKKARARTVEEAREALQAVQIDVSERAGRVEVRTRYPMERHGSSVGGAEGAARGELLAWARARRNVNVSVSYTITAPANTRLTLKTMSGHISVNDIAGEISAEAMSGHVTIERAPRLLTAKTASGHVNITDARTDGTLDTGSMSGNVTLKGVKGRQLNVSCISGSVSLLDVAFERVDATTMSGNVTYEGSLARNGRYGFKSHSGNVRLAIDGNTGFQVDAHAFSGAVRSEVQLTGVQSDGDDSRGRRPRTLRGVYGDGSAVLNLNTFSGSIVIAKR
jgi:putative adhesin